MYLPLDSYADHSLGLHKNDATMQKERRVAAGWWMMPERKPWPPTHLERAKTDFEQSEMRLSLTGGQSSRLEDSGLIQERERSDEAQNAEREAEDRAHALERLQKRLIAASLVENERSEANTSRLDERVSADLSSAKSFRLLSDAKMSHDVTLAALLNRDLFLQVVSHDLRDPLGIISTHASLMRKFVVNGKEDVGSLLKSLDMIERSTAKSSPGLVACPSRTARAAA